MTNRHRGDYFEHQTRDAMEADRWVIIRAAGSFGPADLVALKAGCMPLLLSCKLNGYIPPKERRDVLETALLAGGRALVAMRPRPGWVELRTVHDTPGFEIYGHFKVPTRRKGRT